MWILAAVLVLALAASVYAIFFMGREGPFSAVSHLFEDGERLYGGKGNTSLSADLHKPRNEHELL